MKVWIRRLFATALMSAILAIGIGVGPASADEAAVKYRQTVMKALGGHMGSAAAIMKGQVGHKGHLKDHAEAIAGIGRMTKDLFPKGSDVGKTGALPAIWEKPDEFAKAVAAFEMASANFAKAAASGDMAAVGAAMGGLGGSCGGCHKPFRQK